MTIIIKFFLWLDQIVYNFIGYSYQLFLVLAKTKFFDDNTIQELTSRIYVILGVVMLFVVTYALFRALVNPDEFAKGDNSFGKLAVNIVIALIVIVITPTIFTFAFDIQNAIVDENILGKIILGDAAGSSTSVSGTNTVVEMAGFNIASTVFSSFFYPADEELQSMTFDQATSNVKSCEGTKAIAPTLNDAYKIARLTGSFVPFYDYARNAAEDPGVLNTLSGDCTSKDYIKYNFILSTLVGAFILYVMVSFCIDLGVRVVKLAFYQIITPIPALARVIPGQKKIFDNWIKVIVTTFLEVFIRLLVVFFAVFIIHEIVNNWDFVFGAFELNFVLSLVAKLFVLVGLIMFMKQAPKLISDMFGLDSGNMKLGIGGKLAEGGLGALVGAGVGFIGGKGTGRITGMVGGAKRGFGAKTLGEAGQKQAAANMRLRQAKADGATFFGKQQARIQAGFGLENSAEEGIRKNEAEIKDIENRIAPKQKIIADYERAGEAIGKMENRAKDEIKGGNKIQGMEYKRLQAHAKYLQDNVGETVLAREYMQDADGNFVVDKLTGAYKYTESQKLVTTDMAAYADKAADAWLNTDGMKRYMTDGIKDAKFDPSFYNNYLTAKDVVKTVGLELDTDGYKIHRQFGENIKEATGVEKRKIYGDEQKIEELKTKNAELYKKKQKYQANKDAIKKE